MQQKLGDTLLSTTCFHPENNQYLYNTDLQQLEEELEALRKKHQRLRDLINEQKVTLREVYRNNPPEGFRRQHDALLKELAEADKDNRETFAKATQRLFQTLYHEALHA